MELTNNSVLITGGGSGIGLAIAKEFLTGNNRVMVCGRNLDKLKKAKSTLPQLEIAECDVTDRVQVESLLHTCNHTFGGVNVLINNAAIFNPFHYLENNSSLDRVSEEIDINIKGYLHATHYFLPSLLKKKNASIVNVSSGIAFVPLALSPVYSATKAAIHAWSMSLRLQLKNSGVKVFELMPPLVDTEFASMFKNIPKMSAEDLALEFIEGYKRNRFEIVPGRSAQLRMMRRLAPQFIFDQLNKSL